MKTVMQQLESGLVGVVCGWKRSWNAFNDWSALLFGRRASPLLRQRWSALTSQGSTSRSPGANPSQLGSRAGCRTAWRRFGERGSVRNNCAFHSFPSRFGAGSEGRYGLRAARRQCNSAKENDLNLYVTLFIASLSSIAAEHGVTSSMQALVNPAVATLSAWPNVGTCMMRRFLRGRDTLCMRIAEL